MTSGPAGSGLRLCLLGAPLDSGNLGVSALGMAALAGFGSRVQGGSAVVFDNGTGERPLGIHPVLEGLDVKLRGLWLSRKLHRGESMWRMLASSLVAPSSNENLQALRNADIVWDVSGGDSFSDIYGNKRFRQVVLPKIISVRCTTGLVLLPQTYGPFRSAGNREIARRVVASSREAWARDEDSHDRLRNLLGPDFDPERHRRCADMAFTLPAIPMPVGKLGPLDGWLNDGRGPIVGVNVSGLLSGAEAGERFRLQADYAAGVLALVRRFLVLSEARIVLIPHVVGDSQESDVAACHRLASELNRPDRVTVVTVNDPCHAKWVIGQMDWMTGARMHATIAALSSGTPVTGVAYSDKIAGVFGSCGVRDQVVDARSCSTVNFVDAIWDGWEQRAVTGATLQRRLPATVDTVTTMFDHAVGNQESRAI